MTENQNPTVEPDDTEGHLAKARIADAERDESDDTEGHAIKIRFADAERDETDDTEGHGRAFSDATLKRHVAPLSGALAALQRLRTDGARH